LGPARPARHDAGTKISGLTAAGLPPERNRRLRKLPFTRWETLTESAAEGEAFGRELGVSRVVATILRNRGIDSVAASSKFLSGPLSDLCDPFLLSGMDAAVARIEQALAAGERILVFGDYDVDGVSGTALITRVLRGLGGNVHWYIPHRVRDGYGVSAHAFEEAAQQGAKLIVTTDCGIGAVDEVALMAQQGVDVIVTDHHEPPARLPGAVAVLNPKLPGSAYPCTELAGVGVAFKLMSALSQRLGKSEDALRHHFLDLVALGTIADVVPLVEENRLLARAGLQLLPQSKKVGLQALLRVAGLENRPLSAYHVGFLLGPRLNAAGRLEHAQAALELLLTSEPERATELATQLDATNRERQELERQTLEEALQMVRDHSDLAQDRALVLGSPDWHEGVVGIVASRLVDRFHRPTILVALRAEESKGSGRSISGFSLIDAIGNCSEWLSGFGGHQQAAGITILARKLAGFRKAFLAECGKHLKESDLVPKTRLECLVEGTDLTTRLVQELEQLAPFGLGNPRPVLGFREGVITRNRVMGREAEHLALTVKVGDAPVDCVWWRRGFLRDELTEGRRIAACFRPELNTYGGFERVQLTLEDVRLL